MTNLAFATKNKYDRALFGLCSAVDNFKWISSQLVHPESKRRQILAEHADNLRRAAEKFVEVGKNATIRP